MSIEKTPAKNEILFVWLNSYAGITIKTPSKTLVIDPVDVKPRDFKNVDAILITHEHYDHFDQSLVSEIHRSTRCMIIADQTSARRLSNVISSEKLNEVQPGSEVKIDKVSVKAEKCNHPAATPVSFIITSEDGVKIFHSADSLPFPEMATIGEREKLDVVFCTVGAIAPGASPETGVEIAKLTKPKVAVPYHTGSTADLKKFAEILKKEMPKTTCLIAEIGKIYQVSKRT
jgi:L-ascorbate metabolism protein UlaG (beta-lactamase superfamily)